MSSNDPEVRNGVGSTEKSESAIHASEVVVTVDAQNPWPGLLPFLERDGKYFKGRDSEIQEVFRSIIRQRLTVLLGASGLGKTSLLRAGVFHLLRKESILPVYIRLDFNLEPLDFAEQVWRCVIAEAKDWKCEIPSTATADKTLWEHFHRREADFWLRHRPVAPLLVFDQFEEIFTLGRATPERVKATESLIEDLSSLIDGNPPPTLQKVLDEQPLDSVPFSFDRHYYKLLFSMRVDFSADLDGLGRQFKAITSNRARIRQMDGEAALLAVKQAPNLIEPDVAEEVVRFVSADRLHRPLPELQVEPALLSLFCRELNEKRKALQEATRQPQKITGELLQGNRERILADFYERSVENVGTTARRFIENKLVTKGGHRVPFPLRDAQSEGVSDEAIFALIQSRLIRQEERGGVVQLELSHDRLVEVVKASRDRQEQVEQINEEREAREREALLEKEREKAALAEALAEQKTRANERQRTLTIAAVVLALAGLLASAIAITNSRRVNRELREAGFIADSQALRNSATAPIERSLTAAAEALGISESSTSVMNATDILRALPKPYTRLEHGGPVRSIMLSPTEEYGVTFSDDISCGLNHSRIAENTKHDAVLWRLPAGELIKRFENVALLRFSEDGSFIVTAGVDGDARLWDKEGNLLGEFRHSNATEGVDCISISHDGRKVATANVTPAGDKGTIRIWDISNPKKPREIVSAVSPDNTPTKLVAFSPKGDLLVSADRFIRFWIGLENGSLNRKEETLPRSPATSYISFVENSNVLAKTFGWQEEDPILAVISSPSTLRLASLPKRTPASDDWPEKTQTLKNLLNLPLSPDAYAISQIFPTNPLSENNFETFMGRLSNSITSVMLSRSGLLALSPTRAEVWDITDDAIGGQRSFGTRQLVLPNPGLDLLSAAIGSKRRYLVTGYGPPTQSNSAIPTGGDAQVWLFPDPVFSAISGDGRRAAGVVGGAVVSTRDPLTTPFAELRWPGTPPAADSIALSADGSWIGGANEREYAIWSENQNRFVSGKLTPVIRKKREGKSEEVFDPILGPVAIAAKTILFPRSSILEVHDLESGRLAWRYPDSESKGAEGKVQGNFRGATLSPDARHLAAWTDGKVYLWSQESARFSEMYTNFKGKWASFGPTNESLAICLDLPSKTDGSIAHSMEVRDLSSGMPKLTVSLEKDCQSVTFNHAGNRIAAVTSASIVIADLGSERRQTLAIDATILGATFSRDDNYLAVRSDDGIVRIWDLANLGDGAEVSRFFAGVGDSRSKIAFAVDDEFLFTNGRFFRWRAKSLINEACKSLKSLSRNLPSVCPK